MGISTRLFQIILAVLPVFICISRALIETRQNHAFKHVCRTALLCTNDLSFWLRAEGCNRRSGFRITIFDARTRGDNWKPRLERVVVAGE